MAVCDQPTLSVVLGRIPSELEVLRCKHVCEPYAHAQRDRGRQEPQLASADREEATIPAMTATGFSRDALAAEVAGLTWYHTLELPGGLVTPGEYDTRVAARKVALPVSLDGRRCLDVGTHDGFWAFEMERRGAAEVIAIDLDDPRRADFSDPVPELSEEALGERRERIQSFGCAHRALGSRVQRHDLSVYDLAGAGLGVFDFAFIGTLLLHLREPVRALSAIRSVLRPGGRLLVNDGVSLGMSLMHPRTPVHTLSLLPGKPFWWIPNARGLRRYLEKADFAVIDAGGPYLIPRGSGYDRPPAPGKLASRLVHARGMPHAWVLGQTR
jgi:tRNA (mo5U34)-methyltransferase